MGKLLLLMVALAAPRPVPSCQEVREAVRTGGVRLEDEALYVRSLGLRCKAAAAALGLIGTDSARAVLADRSPELRHHAMLHDVSSEGLDAFVLEWGHHPRLDGVIPFDHPLAALLGLPTWAPDDTLECRLDHDPVRSDREAIEEHLVRAIRGDPVSEEWLWRSMAESTVRPAVAEVLASLSTDAREREALAAWAAWVRENQADQKCVDAWGRVLPGATCRNELYAGSLPVWVSSAGTWWSGGGDLVHRATGEVVLELPMDLSPRQWSPAENLLVGADPGDGGLWFVWPDERRVREVRPVFASPYVRRVDEDRVMGVDATFDAATGDLQGEDRVGRPIGGGCKASVDGYVRCPVDGDEVLLEGRLRPFTDMFEPVPAPSVAVVAPNGRRVGVMHWDGTVDVFDLRGAERRAQPVEPGWPPLLAASWTSRADPWPSEQNHRVSWRDVPRTADGPVDDADLVDSFDSVAFSPDGRAFVAMHDTRERPGRGADSSSIRGDLRPGQTRIRVWDAATGERWQMLVISRRVVGAGFQADGVLRLRFESGQLARLQLGPEAREPQVVALRPELSGCVELEVVQGGEKRRRFFDENGLPCD